MCELCDTPCARYHVLECKNRGRSLIKFCAEDRKLTNWILCVVLIMHRCAHSIFISLRKLCFYALFCNKIMVCFLAKRKLFHGIYERLQGVIVPWFMNWFVGYSYWSFPWFSDLSEQYAFLNFLPNLHLSHVSHSEAMKRSVQWSIKRNGLQCHWMNYLDGYSWNFISPTKCKNILVSSPVVFTGVNYFLSFCMYGTMAY